MIYITGDTHIPIDVKKLNMNRFPIQKQLTKDDFLIICGDFGGVWNTGNENEYWLKWLDAKNFTTLFVDGNHENFDLLNQYDVSLWNGGKVHKITDKIIHLMRGQIFVIDDKKIFTMGGGNSIDKHHRRPHISWWQEEMPSLEEYAEALENLRKHDNAVDYIITHCAPESIMTTFHPDHEDEKPFNLFLEQIKGSVQYKKWFMGHLHEDIEFDDKHFLMYENIMKSE